MPTDLARDSEDLVKAKLDAQRLALSFLASAISELFDDSSRRTLELRLKRWADEAEMRGGDFLYTETAAVLRLMATRVSEVPAGKPA